MYTFCGFLIILGTYLYLWNQKYVLYVCPYQDKHLINYYSKYQNKYFGDSGIDLVIPYNVTLEPYQYKTIHYNIGAVMMTNYQYSSYFIFPRSSMSLYPLIYVNSVSIIDSGFRGNLSTYVYNPTNEPINLIKGTKLVQVCAQDLSEIDVIVNCNVYNVITDWVKDIFSLIKQTNQQHRNLNKFGSSS